MAKLKIDGNDLELALESSGFNGYTEVQNYLNGETGEIIMVSDGEVSGTDDEIDDIDEYVESHDLYSITPMDSRESFQIMDDFVNTLPAGPPRSKLREVLSGPKPFRRFKDAIYDVPHLKDVWYRFHTMREREYLTEMVKGFGVDAEIAWMALPEPEPIPVPQVGGKPAEEVLAEFTWFVHKSPKETCRITVRRKKKDIDIHIDGYNNDRLIYEGVVMSPEDIDPLIAALQQAKAKL